MISRRHVVTAGHCVARASPRQVHVTLGDYVINSAVEPLPAYTFGVRKIDVHPYFKFTPQADRFDVSVLTLERPVHYMPHIGECRRGWQIRHNGTITEFVFVFFFFRFVGFLQHRFVCRRRTRISWANSVGLPDGVHSILVLGCDRKHCKPSTCRSLKIGYTPFLHVQLNWMPLKLMSFKFNFGPFVCVCFQNLRTVASIEWH